MVAANPYHGKYMSCLMMYRGDIFPQEVHESLSSLRTKKTVSFVDWVPTGFKVGINSEPCKSMGIIKKQSRSCHMISNNLAIAEVFSRLDHKFDLLYAKRSFVHWYVGGAME